MSAASTSSPLGPSAAELELRRGLVAGAFAYLLWGLLTIYWKSLQELNAFELIGYRMLCAGVLLVGGLAALGRLRPLLAALRNSHLSRRIAVAAALLTANWTAYVWAVSHSHVIETALGYFMAPLGTMVIGAFLLREELRVVHWAVIGLGAASVGVLAVGYGEVPVVALILAATWSTYGLLKKQVPLNAFESLAAETMLLVLPAAVVVGVTALGDGSIPATADTGQLGLVALSGPVTILPLVLFAHAAQRVPLTVLGALQYLVPIINLMLGWLAYNEEMTSTRLVAFALVWIAIALLTVDTVNRARSDGPRPATSRT